MVMANRIVRWLAAAVILIYGFAKINGSQFTILDSELDKPMGRVSGFWLTWYYFGYSPVYGTFLALVQIAGAMLLTFRRTALLGACLLVPVLGNIVLIDLNYGVAPDATLVAILLLAAMLGIIAPHRRELVNLFLPPRPNAPRDSRLKASTMWILRLAMLGLACGFTYWIANFNNRAPTPIDGAWDVVNVEPASAANLIPAALFFEYNRAHMVVFKGKGGSYETHHFQVEPNTQAVRMWERWLSKGGEIFSGSYALSGSELRLTGEWQSAGRTALTLHRRRVR